MNILLKEIVRVLIIGDLDFIQRGEIIYKKHPVILHCKYKFFQHVFPRLNH